MARREKKLTLSFGRDKGKTFLIREMDAFSCEMWAREAISALHRTIQHTDTGLMLLMSESLREAFETPEVADIAPPAGVDALHPAVKNAQQQAAEEAHQNKENSREATPTQMVAALGLALFLRLPAREQQRVMEPLWGCITYCGAEGNVVLDEAQRILCVEDPQTVVTLRQEAFKLHTDFFTPVVPCLYRRIAQSGTTLPAL